jgi:heavy metal sensor kinase
MRFASNLFNAINQAWKRTDPSSLQFRLTAGVVTFSILGLGSVALWTSWRMQQILIDSHKQNVQDIAQRFPRDVESYSKMMSVQTGLQTVINNRTTPNLFLWVSRPDGKIAAQSTSLWQNNDTAAALLSLSGRLIKTQVYQVNERYLVLCGNQLSVQGAMIGKLYLAQDITRDQTMFLALVRSVSIATILSILVLMLVISIYVRRSLQPLRQMSQLAGTISADDLGKVRLQLERAPSEVKELAQTFNMTLSRLSAAWEQQRQLVSDVSHELRTPLTLVHGYLQSMLRRSVNLTEPQREALEVAASETKRTIRLLQDLLNLARADSGHLYFHFESLVLNDLVVEVVGMVEQFSNRAIAIEAGTFPIKVRADRNCLKQVLINLIDNAVKYSDSDTPITLKIEQIAENAIIQVCDRGYGIPLQQQTRIFERFYRVDEARSTEGSGLGLAIVKTLMEGMGGSVTVRSKLGEGSIFTATLPVNAEFQDRSISC